MVQYVMVVPTIVRLCVDGAHTAQGQRMAAAAFSSLASGECGPPNQPKIKNPNEAGSQNSMSANESVYFVRRCRHLSLFSDFGLTHLAAVYSARTR